MVEAGGKGERCYNGWVVSGVRFIGAGERGFSTI